MNYSGIQILTILPGAWPWAATPLRRCRRHWSSPQEGFSPSWTLRPPQRGRPSFSSLLPLEGERFLLLPPRLHGRNAPRNRRMMNPTPPGAGHSFESPWTFSRPSSTTRIPLIKQHKLYNILTIRCKINNRYAYKRCSICVAD